MIWNVYLQTEMEAAGIRPDVVTYTALMALVVKTAPYRGRSSPTQRYAQFPLWSALLRCILISWFSNNRSGLCSVTIFEGSLILLVVEQTGESVTTISRDV